MGFEFMEMDLKGAYLIRNYYSEDERGGFTKCFEKDFYRDVGINFAINETFVSKSMKNVIRGLHFQTHIPQAKLVSVVAGRAWDVIVDLRVDSPTFKQWRSHELTADNHLSFYVPKGFAHGFASMEDGTIMLYQCDGKYDKETDTGIIFDDPDIGIKWPVDESIAIHSKRDIQLQSFKEYINKFCY